MLGQPAVRRDVGRHHAREPHSPFLAEGLAQLPILSEDVVRTATTELIDAAERLDEDRPGDVVQRIAEALARPSAASPRTRPEGCLLRDHRDRAGEHPPPRPGGAAVARAPSPTRPALFDEDGYVGALLDQLGGARPGLHDRGGRPPGRRPVAPRRERPAARRRPLPARRHRRRRRPLHPRREPRPRGRSARRSSASRSSSSATRRSPRRGCGPARRTGSSRSARSRCRRSSGVPGVRIGERALPIQRGILFNVRPDRVYFDAAARRAFGLCLDREGLATQLDADRPVARAPYRSASWALPTVPAGRARRRGRERHPRCRRVAARHGWHPRQGRRAPQQQHRRPAEPRGPPHVRLRGRRAARRVRHRAAPSRSST